MKRYPLEELETLVLEEEKLKNIKLLETRLPDMHVEVFMPKERITKYNYVVDQLYYIVEGKAKIYMLHEDGKLSLIQFITAGDFIGELTFLGIEKQPKDVVAIGRCMCLAVPLRTAREVLLSDSRFLTILSRYLGEKLLRRTEFFARNQNYELKNRLAAYILFAENEGVYAEKHTETAEFLGISYRHLLYTLKIFQEEGALQKQEKGYRINYEKLKLLERI